MGFKGQCKYEEAAVGLYSQSTKTSRLLPIEPPATVLQVPPAPPEYPKTVRIYASNTGHKRESLFL